MSGVDAADAAARVAPGAGGLDLSGASALVTGGASGLGEAVVRRLHGRCAAVVIVDRDAARGEALAAELDGGARFAAADVTDAGDVLRAVETATAAAPLRVAVNCAGVVIGQRVLGRDGPHDLDAFQRTVAVNLFGSFNVMRLAAEAIARSQPSADGQRGVIVSTASIAAFDGQIGQIAYAASKAGVAGMTLPAARDLAGVGIRVCAVAPGTFETPMLAGLPQATRDELGRAVPFPQRLGRPDEFAALVEHVLDNAMLNGETIRLDGALRMPPR
ncbi:MAG TPA: SDR family NAD(P)-dependent oxidoreductase [Conexibacter sp.]|nr:SDR family NAD(P)-dependent oxidoreductase [Conexibacter sp.]